MPSVMITARSRPPGANVIVDGKPMGRAPLSFLWMDPKAAVGERVPLSFELDGHASKHIRPLVEGDELTVGVALEPLEPAEPVEETEAPATSPTGAQTKTLPAPPEPKKPVLRIVESDDESALADDEQTEEPPAPAPAVTPPPKTPPKPVEKGPPDLFGQPYQ
jgi:hypothetical protein